MKLWVDGAEGSPGKAVRAAVKDQVDFINRKAVSRGRRAVQAIRTAEEEVLKGQRSGRVYRMPGTYGKATKSTKKLAKEYGHKLMGGQLYRASAPGEPPASRTDNLRKHWTEQVLPVFKPGGVEIIAQLESQEKYASTLEYGTSKIARRPFVERIKEKAEPEIRKIYNEPYR